MRIPHFCPLPPLPFPCPPPVAAQPPCTPLSPWLPLHCPQGTYPASATLRGGSPLALPRPALHHSRSGVALWPPNWFSPTRCCLQLPS